MKFTIFYLNSYFTNKKTIFQSIMVCFLIMIIITNSPSAFPELQISNTIGTLQLNQDYFEITREPNEMIKVYGNVNNHVEEDKVLMNTESGKTCHHLINCITYLVQHS